MGQLVQELNETAANATAENATAGNATTGNATTGNATAGGAEVPADQVPVLPICSLGVVCDDLNSLKIDLDRFMAQASADFAVSFARALRLSDRLDTLESSLSQMN